MATLKHLYVAFWRPDILTELQSKRAPCATVCEATFPGDDVTCDTRLISCPACRETFLAALPTGDGKKLTWAAYLALEAAAPIRTLKDRAAELDRAEGTGWQTAPGGFKWPDDHVNPKPNQWVSKPVKTETASGWSTAVPAPKDGWTTGK